MRLIGCGLMGLVIVVIMSPELAAPLFATSSSSDASATYAPLQFAISQSAWLVMGPSLSVAGATVSIATISLIRCGDLVLVWLAEGGLHSLLPQDTFGAITAEIREVAT